MGDIDTAAVDSLKTLDPKRPIREATEQRTQLYVGFVPIGDVRFRAYLSGLDCSPIMDNDARAAQYSGMGSGAHRSRAQDQAGAAAPS